MRKLYALLSVVPELQNVRASLRLLNKRDFVIEDQSGEQVHKSCSPLLYLGWQTQTQFHYSSNITSHDILDSQTNLIQSTISNKETIVTYLVRALKE